MNIVLWVLAGVVVAWITFSFLQWNHGRGVLLAMVIGVIGAVLGGKLLSPMFHKVAASSGAFDPIALVFAVVAAIGVLAISNIALNGWES